jgi:polygalacturonase
LPSGRWGAFLAITSLTRWAPLFNNFTCKDLPEPKEFILSRKTYLSTRLHTGRIRGGIALVLVLLFAASGLGLFGGTSNALAAEICNVGSPSGGDDTSKIQNAINNCPSGGTILLEAGKTYTAGSLYLKSNTTLKFGSASTVLRSIADANKIDTIPQTSHTGFVIGHKVSNVAIEGPGTIQKIAENGHSMVEFQRSSGIRVTDITIDSRGVHYSGFHLVTQGSDHVVFEGVTIYGQQVGSGWPWGGNDGIDVQNSQHVVVRDCFVETHDDGIAIASPKTEIVDDVLIENCTLSSDSAAIKFGTGSLADIQNVTFRNVTLRKSRNAGIRIVNLDGGTFRNIVFENMTIKSDVNAWFLCGKGGSTGGVCVDARNAGGPLGEMYDFTFRNIDIEGGGGSQSKINDITRVTFRDIDFNGASSTVKFADVCGLSIYNLSSDQNINISIASSVSNVVYDGSQPQCGGSSGPPPAPTPSPTQPPPPAPTPTPSPTFEDVPFEHWAYDYVEALYQAGYVSGCSTSPMLYCPEETMTRSEGAVFIVRGLNGESYLPDQPNSQVFADVSLGSWYAKWADDLWGSGYTAGCGTDPLIFCPDAGHTRAEGTVFYLRMLHGPTYVPADPTGLFTDVPLSYWGARWVEAAYTAGLIPACDTSPSLKFCPDDPLARAMGAYMMVQAKGMSIP